MWCRWRRRRSRRRPSVQRPTRRWFRWQMPSARRWLRYPLRRSVTCNSTLKWVQCRPACRSSLRSTLGCVRPLRGRRPRRWRRRGRIRSGRRRRRALNWRRAVHSQGRPPKESMRAAKRRAAKRRAAKGRAVSSGRRGATRRARAALSPMRMKPSAQGCASLSSRCSPPIAA